jgi:aspartate carbamoyltransferase catalytic subunit
MSLLKNGLVDIHHLSTQDMLEILKLAGRLKDALARRDVPGYQLAAGSDRLVAQLFYESSTRTRASFEIAALRLGCRVTGFGSTEGSSVSKGESLSHTIDMFDAYACDAIVLRHPLDGSALWASERTSVPVFNAGDGKRQHPTQTILDLFTILEHHGRLENLNIVFSGDLKYGRTTHTLALALSQFAGNTFHFCSPSNLSMPRAITELVRGRGVKVIESENMKDGLETADIFYQTRIQRERMPDQNEFDKAKKAGAFTLAMMERTRPGFGLMHPLPIDKRIPGIMPELDAHPKALYKTQAGNGVPTRMAELALAMRLVELPVSGRPVHLPAGGQDDFCRRLEIHEKPPREGVSIRPIRDRGVVVDHLQPHTESLLALLLRVKDRRDVYRAGCVRSVARPDHVKGILMIEDRVLTTDELRLVATVSPGARVNRIENGRVVEKYELDLPAVISGVESLMCPNSGCITRPEHQEHVSCCFEKLDAHTLRCKYCDHILDAGELFAHLY